MEIKYGEFKFIRQHKGCPYSGKLMLCSNHIINGKKYPANTPNKWHWCNGRKWVVDPITQNKGWEFCNYSTYGDEK